MERPRPDGAVERRDGAEPDVLLHVPTLKVEEISVEVDELEARVALHAEVANLVKLDVGADVSVGRVKIEIKGVEAAALLKVRLEEVYKILERTLTTIDNNPQLLESLLKPVGEAVGQVGKGVGEAVPELGRGVSQTLPEVGKGVRETLPEVGKGVGEVGKGVGKAAPELGKGVGEVGKGVGKAAPELGKGVGEVGKGVGQAAPEVGKGVGEAGKAAGETAKEAVPAAGQAAGETAKEAVPAAGQAAGETAKEAVPAAGQAAGETTREVSQAGGQVAQTAGESAEGTIEAGAGAVERKGGGAEPAPRGGAQEEKAGEAEGARAALFDGSEDSLQAWAHVGGGSAEFENGTIRIDGGAEPGLLYCRARRFDDVRLRVEFCPSEDADASFAVRFRDPARPVPDRLEPEHHYRYDNPAYVAIHTGFEVQLGSQRPAVEPGTIRGILVGDAKGAQAHEERAEIRANEWNELEVSVRGEEYSVRLNGKETARFSNVDSFRGQPAEASDETGFVGIVVRGGRMRVRKIEAQPVEGTAAAEKPGAETRPGA